MLAIGIGIYFSLPNEPGLGMGCYPACNPNDLGREIISISGL